MKILNGEAFEKEHNNFELGKEFNTSGFL